MYLGMYDVGVNDREEINSNKLANGEYGMFSTDCGEKRIKIAVLYRDY